jgi:hypothetical protein
MHYEAAGGSNREAIESEESLLLAIQAGHAEQLERLGILYKARNVLYERYEDLRRLSEESGFDPDLVPRPRFANGQDMTSVAVCLARPNPFGPAVLVPSLRFISTRLALGGEVIRVAKEVPLELPTGNGCMPAGTFTEQDVETVWSMIHGLDEARAFGALPHLSSDNASIFNPSTAIQKLPDQN